MVEKQGAKEGPHQHLTSEVHIPCTLSYIHIYIHREEEIDRQLVTYTDRHTKREKKQLSLS